MFFVSVKVVGDDSEVTGQCYRSQKRNDAPHRLKVILHAIYVIWALLLESKKGGKDQESIKSSTTPDPFQHMGKWQKYNKTSHTRAPNGQPFPSR